MDIVTHALTGTAIALPWMSTSPEASAGFVIGSVLPDIDALSRVFGKQAFMVCHQTYTHSVGAIAVVIIAAFAMSLLDAVWPMLLLGCAAGMTMHVLLDFTNTLGVKCWLPFDKRRWCTEWAFFIDVPMVVLTLPFLGVIAFRVFEGEFPTSDLSLIYGGSLFVYVAMKAWLRQLAHRAIQPRADSLIPSSFRPWRFLGYRLKDSEQIELLDFDLLSSRMVRTETVSIFDARFPAVTDLPEFKVMRELSPGYHVVQFDETEEGLVVICRDLRTRNFQTRFGELKATIQNATVTDLHFNV